jgi:glycine hydroxymethyltransferase
VTTPRTSRMMAAPSCDAASPTEDAAATPPFFTRPLAEADPAVAAALQEEEGRQRRQIELIAPKNYMSRAARQAFASLIAFTSVEGYPGERWHAGTVNLDLLETLAVERAQEMFGCRYANVQPHSGTQANQATFFALLEPGDRVVSMSLSDGGHLSHGHPNNLAGRWFDVAHYGVRPADGMIDYDELAGLCRRHRPRLLIVGGSSYPRSIDFARARQIADEVGCYLLADVAHFSGLIAAGVYPQPLPYAHVATMSTNKNLRGPRGGLIISDDDALAGKLHLGVFPGVQGGPLPEYMAAKAVCFGEALQPEFRVWAEAVLENARALAAGLIARGYDIVTGATDTPLVLVDLRRPGLTGDAAEAKLELVGLPCNKNLVPGDPHDIRVTSGLRFGTSAVTTRGLRRRELLALAELIADLLDDLVANGLGATETTVRASAEVSALATRFPIYGNWANDLARRAVDGRAGDVESDGLPPR